MTLSYVEAKVVLAQLKKREGLTDSRLAKKLECDFSTVTGWRYRNEPLPDEVHNRLMSYLHVKMEQYGKKGQPFITDRVEARKAGVGGSRLGTANQPDPELDVIRQALRAEHYDRGTRWSELTKLTGVPSGVLSGIARETAKTVYPENKAKLLAWHKDWMNSYASGPEGQSEPEVKSPLIQWAEDRLNPEPDAELEAIRKILKALEGLELSPRHRVLSYCLSRAAGNF